MRLDMKKKVLILNTFYLPGFRSGGPTRSCANMVEELSDRFEFLVLCTDRDLGSQTPYEQVQINAWNPVGSASVYYAGPDALSLRCFDRFLRETAYDVLYLNGFFSYFTTYALLLRRFGRLRETEVIVTSRGHFVGDMKKKKLKKYSYLILAKVTGLYRNVLWHAASELEATSIRRFFPRARIFVAANLPENIRIREPVLSKTPGELRLVFVSRISSKKNLFYALNVLQMIQGGHIIFDIYGPIGDATYWKQCEAVIENMPAHIAVNYRGEVPHEEVPHIFEQYHAFFFPTLGENYGHAIVEAMMSSCVCILSRGVTPWDEYLDALDLGAPLKEPQGFQRIIERLLAAGQEEMNLLLEKNRAFCLSRFHPEEEVEKYVRLLGGSAS